MSDQRRTSCPELMAAERFEVVRSLYVVLPTSRGDLYWWNWLLWPESRWGDTMPRQVPNRSMRWRRPTYEETIARQQAFEERDDWLRLHTKHQQAWRSKYGRPEEPVRVLVGSGMKQPLSPGETP